MTFLREAKETYWSDHMDKKEPLFSVIIPAYNIESYIEACIASVLAQTFSNYELILINDGSIDGTGAICKRKAKDNSCIRYIEKKNEGLSAARNDGIRSARGKYLLFLDGDDVLKNDALSIIAQILDRDGMPDVLLTRYESFNEQTNKVTEGSNFPKSVLSKRILLSVPQQFRECYLKNDIRPMAQLSVVKRVYLFGNRLFFELGILHEDELWTPQVFLHAEKIGYCSKITYCYRVNREGSITKKYQKRNIQDKMYIIQRLREIAKAVSQRDPEKAKLYESRAACMLNGIINVDFDLINEPELIDGIRANIDLFKRSIQKKYLILYITAKMFSIKGLIRASRMIKRRF